MQALLDADVCAEVPLAGKFSELSSKFSQAPQAVSVNDNWFDSGSSLPSRRDDAVKAPFVYGAGLGEEVVPAVKDKAPTAATGGAGGGGSDGGDGATAVVTAKQTVSHPLGPDGDSSRKGLDNSQAVEEIGTTSNDKTEPPPAAAAVSVMSVAGRACAVDEPSLSCLLYTSPSPRD